MVTVTRKIRAELRRVRWLALVAVVAVLAVSNVLINRVLPEWVYVPWNLAVATLVAVIALRAGVRFADLGVSSQWLRRSLVVGLIGFGAFAVIFVAGALLPWTRSWFDDARVEAGWPALAYHALIKIPLGTVLLEEVAFRGVLPALLGLRGAGGWRWFPVLGSGVLFGLWHVLPAITLVAGNSAVHDLVGGEAPWGVVGAVVAAAGAGVLLSATRWAGRGLLTPITIHIGTNSLALVTAWLLLS